MAGPKSAIKNISESELAELEAKTGALKEYKELVVASSNSFGLKTSGIHPLSTPESLKAIMEMSGGAKGYMQALA